MLLELAIFLIIFIVWWRLEDQKRHKGFPPGPPRYPVVGCLPTLLTKSPIPTVAFEDLAKKYGDVMYLKVGALDTIVITSYDAIMGILNHEKAADRGGHRIPLAWERGLKKNLGILWGNGEPWVSNRRFTLRTLRDFGFGKTLTMDFVINEELDKFMKHIDSLLESSPDGNLHFEGFFDSTVINVLWRLVTGVNYELNDPKIIHLLRISDEMVKNSSFAFDFSIAFPPLRDWFPKFFATKEMRKITKELHDFAWDTIREHRASGTYASDPKGFVDCYLEKIDEHGNAPDSHFNDEQLLLTILDLFQAGAETTSKTLGFAVLYMLRNQEAQEKIQAEIDSVVPEDSPISMSMKSQLPYCYAALLETLRYSSVVPFPPIRAAAEDFMFQGHFIQKGIAIMPNLQALHFDAKIWGDPNEFKPERFLTSDGKVDTKMADFLIPFGSGRRICVGKALAETNLFLYFTTIFRNYQFLRIPGRPDPSIEPIVGMTNAPHPFDVHVVRRFNRSK